MISKNVRRKESVLPLKFWISKYANKAKQMGYDTVHIRDLLKPRVWFIKIIKGLIRENRSSRSSRASNSRWSSPFDILSASNLGGFSLKSDTVPRPYVRSRRTSGPCAHPRDHIRLSRPFNTRIRNTVTRKSSSRIVFSSWLVVTT